MIPLVTPPFPPVNVTELEKVPRFVTVELLLKKAVKTVFASYLELAPFPLVVVKVIVSELLAQTVLCDTAVTTIFSAKALLPIISINATSSLRKMPSNLLAALTGLQIVKLFIFKSLYYILTVRSNIDFGFS